MEYLLLIVGFVGLIKGADFFVDGSSSIAKKLGIPAMIIGLTIVSLGTSLPEAAVSITASLEGSNDLSISNVTGSNIFNLMVVVAVCAMMKPMSSSKSLLKRDFPVTIGASVLLLLFLLDSTLTRLEAVIFLVACFVYIFFLVKSAKSSRLEMQEIEKEVEQETKVMPMWKSLLLIGIGIAGIIIGGELVVNSAVTIAASFGMSQSLIGVTIVAVGTSLPELVTSIVAAKKGETDLALGNALGSCILNIFFILGISASISPITIDQESFKHVIVMLSTTALMFLFAFTGRKTSRVEGLICLLVYLSYMSYTIYNSLIAV